MGWSTLNCWNDYPEARYKYPFSEISQHIQSIRALFSRSSSIFVKFCQQMVKNHLFSPRKRPFHSTWSKGQNRAFSNFS